MFHSLHPEGATIFSQINKNNNIKKKSKIPMSGTAYNMLQLCTRISCSLHEILKVLDLEKSLQFFGIQSKFLEISWKTESGLKMELGGKTAERYKKKISAHRDSPPQLDALPTPLSPTRLSGLSSGSRL